MGTAPEVSIALRPGPDDDLARISDLSRVVCGRMRGTHAMFSVFLWSFHAATTCQCYVRRPSWRRLGRFRGFRCCGQGTSVVSRPLLRLPRVGVESAVPESAGDVKRRLGEAPSVKPSTSPAVPSPEGEMACIVGRAGAGKTWDKQASRRKSESSCGSCRGHTRKAVGGTLKLTNRGHETLWWLRKPSFFWRCRHPKATVGQRAPSGFKRSQLSTSRKMSTVRQHNTRACQAAYHSR